ncbi:Glycosyl phosphatidyl inositol anchor synthesis [Blastocladiella emersonii ATCC 22665]|nr:Glycosyl phosphatidyl inositol anchor synthesis [Blastocladiella emersonii ATCC 22665]
MKQTRRRDNEADASPRSRKTHAAKLLLLGVLFHAIYAVSIFDIYFTSPVVRGMSPAAPTLTPPARRVVLMVADGLRADTLFANASRAPFLHSIARDHGVWGVAHTRVPTESRPGHVALLAGMYEDVSAVTKGWKMNPVEFDSIVNASSAAWTMGSPDILPMFRHGADRPERIRMDMYSAEEEDFAGKHDASALDAWVFDRFEGLLRAASAKRAGLPELPPPRNEVVAASEETHSTDANLIADLHQDRVVIFLHLLGLDTNGHAFRPHSDPYRNNLHLVDDGIRRTTQLIDEYFGDGRTAFVFSADHGMHARGNHGDGDPQNTLTPLIAWGAGVRGPLAVTDGAFRVAPDGSLESEPDTYPGVEPPPAAWPLHQSALRRDVLQADVSPLLASLAGTRIPSNGVGVLHTDLLADSKYAFDALRANARQIMFQYLTKAQQRREREPWYRPYPPLAQLEESADPASWVQTHGETSEQLRAFIQECLEGLSYLQKYDWLFLRAVVSLGYVAWMAYSLSHVTVPESLPRRRPYAATVAVCAVVAVYLWVKHAPATYYLYCGFAAYLVDATARRIAGAPRATSPSSSTGRRSSSLPAIAAMVAYVVGLECLVASYEHRGILAVLAAGLALWPFVPASSASKSAHVVPECRSWRAVWSGSVAMAGAATLLPPVGGETDPFQLGGGAALVLALSWLWSRRPTSNATSRWHCQLRFALAVAATANVAWIVWSLGQREGLPPVAQAISWCILLASPATLFLGESSSGATSTSSLDPVERVADVAAAMAPLFILLSTAYELAFFACYATACVAWAGMERATIRTTSTATTTSLAPGDVRAAFTFLTLIHLGFFGTGNIASLASFTLASVYRLVTVFAPFLMGALLIVKILIPFVVASGAFRVVAHVRALSLRRFLATSSSSSGSAMVDPFALFLVVVSTCDVMTLHFFWKVRDEGSWLEIGTSISHFGIASGFLVFLFVLYLACGLVLGNSLVHVPQSKLA